MPEYTCTNGPLAGAVLYTHKLHTVGEVMDLEVVDVGQTHDAAEIHHYSVARPAGEAPGQLTFAPGPTAA